MRALVYAGIGRKELHDRPRPGLRDATDAIVAMTRTTLCGTDLHILAGHVPTCEPGRILGHEGTGVVAEVGAAVTSVVPGDRVLLSCITSCGRCAMCRRGMPSQCTTGGWLLGHHIDGTQAEYVRVPHADGSLHRLPAGTDEDLAVLLSDVLPTGLECGVLRGAVTPGATVAIVGAGPIGLAVLMTAQWWTPSQIVVVDPDENRLAAAMALGATAVARGSAADVRAEVLRLTDGLGADTVVEAVGLPATFELCQELVAAGGVIANVGVHGSKVDLHLERLWSRNVAVTTRLVDTGSIPLLLRMLAAGRLRPAPLVSHRLDLDRILEAYALFADAAHSRALKVVLSFADASRPSPA